MPLVLIKNPDEPVNWKAEYSWSRERGGPGLTVRWFRLSFDLDVKPDQLLIHVTADSRYRLYVNGESIGLGPLKGTLRHYHVESYDLAPHIRVGRNVLAAEVRWFGDNAPESEVHSNLPGWLVYAPDFPELDTPGNWRVKTDNSVRPDVTPYNEAQQFLNHTEIVDMRLREEVQWTAVDYDDSGWEETICMEAPVNSGVAWGLSDLRKLYPRDLPALSEKKRRFVRTIRNHHVQPHLFGESPHGWKLDAGEGGVLVLDAGEMTTGYPVLLFNGGRDREVRIAYAEAMSFQVEKNGECVWEKRIRNDISGEPYGYRDTLILSGRPDAYEPFHWRTFWFVKIEILPGAEPCELIDVNYRRCVFPQALSADFSSSDQQCRALWETSWRTAQLCAHETYEDCPYFEQLNYIADTRLQALVSYYLANETRLGRRCLRIYRDSLRPDGMISSREPSRSPQIIPYFCLHWIFMLEDYWQWMGERDVGFVRECLPIVDHILVFFRQRLRADGFVGHVPQWNMVDNQPGWIRGEPPALLAGASTYLTCTYIQALESAIRLHEQAGLAEDAERWRQLPARLRAAVNATSWSQEDGIYLEGPGREDDLPSQHTQCAAISAKVPNAEQLSRIVARLRGEGLLQASLMQGYYVARAYEQAGTYGLMHSQLLNNWRGMLSMGTSTWWEYPKQTRSDCHAWGSWIAVDFLSTVLGIRPGAPGWSRILLAPQTEGLDRAKGTMHSPVGRIDVEWCRKGEVLEFSANTPDGVPVELILPGHEVEYFAVGGSVSLKKQVQHCFSPCG